MNWVKATSPNWKEMDALLHSRLEPIIEFASAIFLQRFVKHGCTPLGGQAKRELQRMDSSGKRIDWRHIPTEENVAEWLAKVEWKIMWGRKRNNRHATAYGTSWKRLHVGRVGIGLGCAREMFNENIWNIKDREAFLVDLCLHELAHLFFPYFTGRGDGHQYRWRLLSNIVGSVPQGSMCMYDRLDRIRGSAVAGYKDEYVARECELIAHAGGTTVVAKPPRKAKERTMAKKAKLNIATITVRGIVAGKTNKQILAAIQKSRGKSAGSLGNIAWYRSRITKGHIDTAKYAA